MAAELRLVSTGYTAARPCLLALLARIEHVNDTVLELPSNINVRPQPSSFALLHQSCALNSVSLGGQALQVSAQRRTGVTGVLNAAVLGEGTVLSSVAPQSCCCSEMHGFHF